MTNLFNNIITPELEISSEFKSIEDLFTAIKTTVRKFYTRELTRIEKELSASKQFFDVSTVLFKDLYPQFLNIKSLFCAIFDCVSPLSSLEPSYKPTYALFSSISPQNINFKASPTVEVKITYETMNFNSVTLILKQLNCMKSDLFFILLNNDSLPETMRIKNMLSQEIKKIFYGDEKILDDINTNLQGMKKIFMYSFIYKWCMQESIMSYKDDPLIYYGLMASLRYLTQSLLRRDISLSYFMITQIEKYFDQNDDMVLGNYYNINSQLKIILGTIIYDSYIILRADPKISEFPIIKNLLYCLNRELLVTFYESRQDILPRGPS